MPSYPKMHVKRIYHTDSGGAPDHEVWIDVLRVDAFRTVTSASPDQGAYQGVVWYLRWLDDDAEDNNPARITHLLTLYDPASGVQIPPPGPHTDGTVDLALMDKTTTVANGYWSGRMGEGAKRIWKNYTLATDPDDSPNKITTARDVVAVRVVNNGLGGLDMTAGPVDWATYLDALLGGTQDKSQYVDVEVVGLYKTFQNAGYPAYPGATPDVNPTPGTPTQTARTASFGGARSRKAFGADTLDTLASVFSASPDSAAPVFRTDPYQVIVNVQWEKGQGTFIAIDEGTYAITSANNELSFADFDPGTNYPGGYNVWSSSDGINWRVQKQGVVDTNPNSFYSTDRTPAGYSWIGTVTIYSQKAGVAPFTRSYIGVISEEGGGSPLPPDVPPNNGPVDMDGAGTIALPPSITFPPMVYPFWVQIAPALFEGGIPRQPDFIHEYGFYTGSPPTVIAPFGAWGCVNSVDQQYTAWNITPGPVEALDGISEFIASSSDPLRVFVIGGNGYAGSGSGMTLPFYYRSTDGVTWTQFTPPFNPTAPWFPFITDCWFDDGTQRTITTDPHGDQSFDGTPTKLWFSSRGTPSDPLWQSSDGCVTWQSSHYLFGNNPATSKSDDVYVGDPSTTNGDPSQSSWYGEMGTTASFNGSRPDGPSTNQWSRVFGQIANGHRMGVQIQAFAAVGAGTGFLYAGPADEDPSTWTAILLPIPPNAELVREAYAARELEEYNLGIANYTIELEIAQNQLAACQDAATWGHANGYSFVDGLDYMVTEMESLVSQIEAVLASIGGPPGPNTAVPNPLYVAYAVPPGQTDGIFVCAGGLTIQRGSDGANEGSNAPLFWWSKDAMTWSYGNYDYDYASDEWANTSLQFLVSGNPAEQLFPVTPSP